MGASSRRKRAAVATVQISIGMLGGLMLATAGAAAYPSLAKTAVTLVCDGQARFESLAPRDGLMRFAPARRVSCVDAADGSEREVTGTLVAVSTVIYGAIFSVLLLLLNMPWTRTRSRHDASAAVHALGVRQSGIDELMKRIQRRDINAVRTFVSRDGQPVDRDVAADVSRLLQSIAQSRPKGFASGSSEHDMQAIFGKIANGHYQTNRSSEALDEQLRQLKRLHDEHLITDAEYASKKSDLLSRL